MKYYIYDDDDQHGPFSFDELKSKNLTRSTMIWREGLDEWTRADDVEELKPLLQSVPPSIKKTIPPKLPVASRTGHSVGRYFLLLIVVVLVVAYLSNPKLDQHRFTASAKLNEKLENFKDQVKPKKKFWKVVKEIGFTLASSHLQKKVQERIAITDYGVCSFTKVRLSNREVTVGFGAFGQVWLFTEAMDGIEPNDLID